MYMKYSFMCIWTNSVKEFHFQKIIIIIKKQSVVLYTWIMVVKIIWCLAFLAPYVTCVEHHSQPAALSHSAVLVADASPQSSSDTFPLCKQDKPNRFEPRQKPSARPALSGLHRNESNVLPLPPLFALPFQNNQARFQLVIIQAVLSM